MELTMEYRSYRSMIDRCYVPTMNGYENYGGRGIKVCKRWRHSYENFLRDMRLKPDPSYTIDRIDSDGDYGPGNCVWATRTQQVINRRRFRNNRSGYTGVSWCSRDKLWVASITIHGKKKILGSSKDIAKAVAMRKQAEPVFHGMYRKSCK